MFGIFAVLMFLLTALVAGCGSGTPAPASAPTPPAASPLSTPVSMPQSAPAPLQLETLSLSSVLTTHGSVSPSSPTNLVQADSGQVLVTDQSGLILSYDEASLALSSDAVSMTETLDIRDRVSRGGSEEGLLGLAVDPDDQGHLYVYYSAANPRRSVVSRFDYSSQTMKADTNSELVILEVAQPYSNHNGGQIAFGPDGYLYIGLGDGGSAGDPQDNGQDTSTLLGSILRIDVSNAAPGQPYSVPPGNPFADGGGRPEIWAYGLRNPWRFSFDRATGALWTGDVGQNRWEEIDLVRRGGNYGWNTLEGNHCFQPSQNCNREGTTPPVWEYSLDGKPCSVIGGYVYRGPTIPWLTGTYVYGDFCSGKVFGLRYANGQVIEHKELADTGLRIMSFAEDNNGNLYLLSQNEGIHRLTAKP